MAHAKIHSQPRAMSDERISVGRLLREDYRIIIVIVALPLLLLVPALVHLINEDPAIARGLIANKVVPGLSPGYSYIDPNVGFTTQALGHLDVTDLLHGIMPWWNPYSGAGLPLAAELQNAPFLPLTLLMAFHGGLGVELEHALLGSIAGVGTYLLARSLGLSRLASLTGGLLFALNGTFAWFGDNPSITLTFIPWVMLGVEVAIQKTHNRERGTWQLLAVATALLLLAGFPETAYVALILAGVFALLRVSYLARTEWLRALWYLVLGVGVGALISVISLGPFAEAIPHEYLGAHVGSLSQVSLPLASAPLGLLAPYVDGPIFGASSLPSWLLFTWSNVGGFVSIALLLVAVYGLVTRWDRLSIGLGIFVVFFVGRAYGVAPFSTLINLLPESQRVAVFRYANPSWELALIILAVRGVDALVNRTPRHRWGVLAAAITALLAFMVFVFDRSYLREIWDDPALHAWMLWSLVGIVVVTLVVMAVLFTRSASRGGVVLAAILVMNALVLFCIPIAANPRSGSVDHHVISFLQSHLGDYRVYSMNVLQPNYSAFYRIPSIDYNYLPIPDDTVSWVNDHLEPEFTANPVTMNGANTPLSTAQPWAASVELDLKSYEAMGVRDILVAKGSNPFEATVELPAGWPAVANRAVPSGPGLKISAHTTIEATLPTLSTSTATITSLSVTTVQPDPHATGIMDARICSGLTCVHADASLSAGVFTEVLPTSLVLQPGRSVTVELSWPSLSRPVALVDAVQSGAPYPMILDHRPLPSTDVVLGIGMSTMSQVHLVYSDATTSVYQLNKADPILSVAGGNCKMLSYGVSSARYSCRGTGSLTYRETSFPGWSATLGHQTLPITTVDGLFQRVTVPPGTHTVRFRYQPPHEGLFEGITALALIGLIISAILDSSWLRRRLKRS